jgi:hypothetical protein
MNNLHEYADGFYCFACNYYKPNKSLENARRNLSPFNERTDINLCNDLILNNSLEIDHLKWLLGYNLTQEEMALFKSCTKRRVNNEFRECSLLVFHCSDNYWVARNFGEGVKYLSRGVKPYLEFGSNKEKLVFVEDIISAVKVARVATAVPMLGAKVMPAWWEQAKKYNSVVLWGDRDKATENVVQARRASEVIGKKVEIIITEKDPKHYSVDEILSFLY